MNNCCTGSFDECSCDCHRYEGVYHVIACCNQCPHCLKNIKPFGYEHHVETCKEEQEERNKAITAILANSGLVKE